MTELEKRTISSIVLSGLAGLLIFLILLAAANYMTNYVDNPVFLQIVGFLNNNIDLLIIMSVIFLIGKLFTALVFPLNLPAPLFNAAGSVFLVAFIFKIFELTASITKEYIFYKAAEILAPLSMLVFIIVLLGGYFLIFTRLSEENENKRKNKKEQDEKKEKEAGNKKYCMHCGSRINAGDNFCNHCGGEQTTLQEKI